MRYLQGMKVPRAAKITLLVGAALVVVCVSAIAFWTTQGNSKRFGVKPYADGRLPATMSLRIWDLHSTDVIDIQIDTTTSPGRELGQYLAEVTGSGGTLSIATYAPGLVIDSELISVNILKSAVVISKRTKDNQGFGQWVREKNAKDEAIERIAQSLLPPPQPAAPPE